MSIVEETTIQLSKRCREKERGRKTKGERERERNEGKKKNTVGKWTWNCMCPLNPSAGASKMPPGKHFTDSTDFLASAQSEHRRTSTISRALQTNKRSHSPNCWTSGPGRLHGCSDFAISIYIRYQNQSRPVFWHAYCWQALQVSFPTAKLWKL